MKKIQQSPICKKCYECQLFSYLKVQKASFLDFHFNKKVDGELKKGTTHVSSQKTRACR